MNYLAHVFLSHSSDDAVVGAMLGDFVKGRVDGHWSPAVRAAILLHRAVDGFTDAHALTAASRALVSAKRRRFAGILIDIFWDHFLARQWSRFHATPLTEFTRGVYAVLWPRRGEFPPRLQRILPSMMRDDWLASYADSAAVDAALKGMTRRFRNPTRAAPLADGVLDLQQNYVELEGNFLDFVPELRRFALAASGLDTDVSGTPGRTAERGG